MKGWITVALVVTFLSGTSTGFLLGRSSSTTERPTWKDRYVEQLKRVGVTDQEALDRAREILDEYETKAQAVKSQLPKELQDKLRELGEEAKNQIQEIIDASKGPEKPPR